jgi:hypothetical protein
VGLAVPKQRLDEGIDSAIGTKLRPAHKRCWDVDIFIIEVLSACHRQGRRIDPKWHVPQAVKTTSLSTVQATSKICIFSYKKEYFVINYKFQLILKSLIFFIFVYKVQIYNFFV